MTDEDISFKDVHHYPYHNISTSSSSAKDSSTKEKLINETTNKNQEDKFQEVKVNTKNKKAKIDGPALHTRSMLKSPSEPKRKYHNEKRGPTSPETKNKISESMLRVHEKKRSLKNQQAEISHSVDQVQINDLGNIPKRSYFENCNYQHPTYNMNNTGLYAYNPFPNNLQYQVANGLPVASQVISPINLPNSVITDNVNNINQLGSFIDEKLANWEEKVINIMIKYTSDKENNLTEKVYPHKRSFNQHNEYKTKGNSSKYGNQEEEFNMNYTKTPTFWNSYSPERKTMLRIDPKAPISPPKKKRDAKPNLQEYIPQNQKPNDFHVNERINYKERNEENYYGRNNNYKEIVQNKEQLRNPYQENLKNNHEEYIQQQEILTVKGLLTKPPDYTHIGFAKDEENKNLNLKEIWEEVNVEELKWLLENLPAYDPGSANEDLREFMSWVSEISTHLRQLPYRQATYMLTRLIKPDYTTPVLEKHRSQIAEYSIETASQLYGQEIYRQLDINPLVVAENIRIGKDKIRTHNQLMKRVAEIHSCRSGIIPPVVWCDDLVRGLARHLRPSLRSAFVQKVSYRYPYLQEFANHHKGRLESAYHLPNSERASDHMPLSGKDCKEFAKWVISLACGKEFDLTLEGVPRKDDSLFYNNKNKGQTFNNNENKDFNKIRNNNGKVTQQNSWFNNNFKKSFQSQNNQTNGNKSNNNPIDQSRANSMKTNTIESSHEAAIIQENVKKEYQNFDPNAKCYLHPKGDHNNCQCFVQHPELKPKPNSKIMKMANNQKNNLNEVNAITANNNENDGTQFTNEHQCCFINYHCQENQFNMENQNVELQQCCHINQYQSEVSTKNFNNFSEETADDDVQFSNEITSHEPVQIHQDENVKDCLVRVNYIKQKLLTQIIDIP